MFLILKLDKKKYHSEKYLDPQTRIFMHDLFKSVGNEAYLRIKVDIF